MKPRLHPDEVSEGLTTVVLALREDLQLSSWFESLEDLSVSQRQVELIQMRRKLVSSGTEDTYEVASYLMLLADDRIFAAAFLAYRTL